MPDSKVELATTKLSDLLSALEEDDYKAAVEVCEAYLNTTATTTTSTDDGDSASQNVVLEIYLKSLLQCEDYEKVIMTNLDGNGDQKKKSSSPSFQAPQLKPLQMYALYRLAQYDRVLDATKNSTSNNSNMEQYLRGQAFFKSNRTKEALKVYQDMIQKQQAKNDDNEVLAEVYTNAMAVLVATATPYQDIKDNDATKLLQQAREFYENHSEESHDLAYNVATLSLFQARTARARREALELMNSGIKNAKALLASETSSKQLPQELIPMAINARWGRALWGEHGGTLLKSSDDSTSMNGMLEQIHPVLVQPSSQSTKMLERAIQLMQLLLMNHNSSKNNGRGPSRSLTPLQEYLCQYNQAVLLLHIRQYKKCRQVLATLGQSLGADAKKKKNVTTTSAMDMSWWQIRVDVLLAYSYFCEVHEKHTVDDDDDEMDEGNAKKRDKSRGPQSDLNESIKKLKQLEEKLVVESALDNDNLIYLQLHLQQLQEPAGSNLTTEHDIQWLEKMHKQHQSRKMAFPALTASLVKCYQERNENEKVQELFRNDFQSNNKDMALADMALAQQKYVEAASLYEQALQKASEEETDVIRARFIEALSHVDPKRALAEWKVLEVKGANEHDSDDEVKDDGESLELRALPRMKQQVAVPELVGVDSRPTVVGPVVGNKKKRKDANLRRRSKQRQEYLKNLEEKGLYNSSRPTQPDPERWIPKHERHRRRRRGGQQSKSSQGGVSANDAAKLDVMARATGAVDPTATGRSTAHLSVAGGKKIGRK